MAQSDKFKNWHKIETAKILGKFSEIDKIIDEQMIDKNIKIEYIN